MGERIVRGWGRDGWPRSRVEGAVASLKGSEYVMRYSYVRFVSLLFAFTLFLVDAFEVFVPSTFYVAFACICFMSSVYQDTNAVASWRSYDGYSNRVLGDVLAGFLDCSPG